MPAAQRGSPIPLIGRLLSRPQQFEFFQAVRLLEAWTGTGRARSLRSAPITFHNRLSMSFPSSDIDAIEVRGNAPTGPAQALRPNANVQIRVTPAFMGLLGATGTLPHGFTESVAAAQLHEAVPLGEFFDLLSQRNYTLFCEAWAKAQITYDFDSGGCSPLLPTQLSIAGSATRSPDPVDGSMREEVRAFYGGLFRMRSASGAVLGQVLTDYFEVPIAVQTLRGEWSALEKTETTVLGQALCTLGTDAVIGARTFQRDQRIRLRVGPLNLAQFRDFGPRSNGTKGIAQMLACFPVTQFQFEVNLVLRGEDVRPSVLGQSTSCESGGTTGLGMNAFLAAASDRNRDDLVFDLIAPTQEGE